MRRAVYPLDALRVNGLFDRLLQESRSAAATSTSSRLSFHMSRSMSIGTSGRTQSTGLLRYDFDNNRRRHMKRAKFDEVTRLVARRSAQRLVGAALSLLLFAH